MGDFIYFTEEQKERANAVPIMDILKREHEEVERSGNEWRWKRHGSVTFRGNRWYRHSQQMGSHAIDFMQEFFGIGQPKDIVSGNIKIPCHADKQVCGDGTCVFFHLAYRLLGGVDYSPKGFL